MEYPLVSVVIPLYNCSRTLRECLSSVMQQTYKNYEVVLVYTPSNDNTLDIATEALEDGRIRCIQEDKRGRGVARNRGILEAKGQVIGWTDADCEVPNTWLEKLVEPILKGEEKIVQGAELGVGKSFWSRMYDRAYQRSMVGELDYVEHIDTKNLAIRKDVLTDVGMFNDNLVGLEDFDLRCRLNKAGYKIRYIRDIKVAHNHRDSFFTVIQQRSEEGYWAYVIYHLHKEFLDSEARMSNSVKHLSVSYLLKTPLKFVSFLFKHGVSDAFFMTVMVASFIYGNTKARLEFINSNSSETFGSGQS